MSVNDMSVTYTAAAITHRDWAQVGPANNPIWMEEGLRRSQLSLRRNWPFIAVGCGGSNEK